MIGLKKNIEEKKKQQETEDAAEQMDVESEAAPASTQGPAQGRGRGRGRGAGGDQAKASIWGVKGAGKERTGNRRMRPGEIRVQRDVGELDGGECAVPNFPNPDDLMNFEVVITPNDGYWSGYSYTFDFTVPDMYPHDPPKVHCRDPIYHPNIDLKGNVCLNILRGEWKPVLDLNAVIYGLIVLFDRPNGEDPLNHEAAKCLRDNQAKFKQNVEKSLKGLEVDGHLFPPARRG